MKKRYMLPFLLLVFLFANTSQVRAELSLEEYVVAALENYETEIDVSAYNISRSEGGREYLRILNDNPQLFYVQEQISTEYIGDKVVCYRPSYLVEKEEAMQMREELETAVQQALEQVEDSMNAVQKALVVHDYLVQNCEYDQERLMAGNVPDISHTAYGSLVNKMAVCDGYADAYAYIMEHKLGIPCTVVSSEAMNHAWNMIEIDGEWYHADLTYDDPVWDRIGRVSHNYFLLSDQAISQDHVAWTQGYTADSERYDQEFWIGVESAISYYNGAWYYSESQVANRRVVLKKKADLFDGYAKTLYQTSPWEASAQSFYRESFMYLAQLNRKLYFNTHTEIMQVDADGDIQIFWEPDDLAGKQIFGFTVQGGEFLYAPNDVGPSGKQSDIRRYSHGEIPGITVANVTGVYNGNPYKIEIQGLTEGDVVHYALAGGADMKYSETQPDMTNAGTYRVRYRVDREGVGAHEGIATVTIAKAEPEYTIPQECAGKCGGTLADIALPEGFAWKTPQTRLYQEKTRAFPAVYTPKDAVNYKTVNVDIMVNATCPGHKYRNEVTKSPTEKEEGIRTYICIYCTASYTETIPKLETTEPGTTEPGTTEPGTTVKDISKTASIVMSATTYTYNGKPQTPEVSVREGNTYLRKGDDYTVSYQDNTNIGTASLTVTGIGNYNGKLVKKFTIVPKGTSISGAVKAQKKSLTVKWKKQEKSIDGYEIWCSTSKKFTKSVTVKKTAKKTAVKLTVKKLKARTGYYVKVRTYKKVNGEKLYSSWSKVKSVKTKG